MIVNTEALENAIRRKGFTKDAFAIALGINPSTLYRRLQANGETFTVGEVHRIGEILDLNESALSHIFLKINSQK